MSNSEVKNDLSSGQYVELIKILKARFEKNMTRHVGISWEDVETKLKSNDQKLLSLSKMEESGGEPDVIEFDPTTGEYTFYDCATESPKGRRNLCYDNEALNSRKEFKPKDSAINMAYEMGIEILDEEQYRKLQRMGNFDLKTSSWIKTPADIRKLGGAIFADKRYNNVFVYHNGAESYYGVRGFRGLLTV